MYSSVGSSPNDFSSSWIAWWTLYVSYGYYIRKGSATSGTIVATIGERIGAYANSAGTINLPSYNSKSFTTTITLEDDNYYIVPFITNIDASAYTDYPDVINSLTLTVYTPQISSATVSVAVGKTEVIPGGFQVVRDTNNWVKIDRALGGGSPAILQVGGEITATNNITAYASDKRLKENIIKIDNPIDRVMQLHGVHYDWKPNTIELGFLPSQKNDTGVLAQDVQNVLPNAVKIAPFDNDGNGNSKSGQNYLTVQYEKIVPLLIEAIKELKGEIDKLKRNK